MRGFARDVVVSVLANLIAAAIIYLLGLLAGLFPLVHAAVELSLGVLVLGSMLVAMTSTVGARTRVFHAKRSMYVIAVALIVGGVALLIGSWLVFRASGWDRTVGVVSGFLLAVLGVMLVWLLRFAARVEHAPPAD